MQEAQLLLFGGLRYCYCLFEPYKSCQKRTLSINLVTRRALAKRADEAADGFKSLVECNLRDGSANRQKLDSLNQKDPTVHFY